MPLLRLARTARISGPNRGDPRVDIVKASALAADPAAWDDLLVRAAEPHPYFSRHVVEAHRRAGLLSDDLTFVCVRSGDRLDALLPFKTGFDITGFGSMVAQPALSPFMPSSTPLVALDFFEQTMQALAHGLVEASAGRSWRWPLLSVSSRVGAGLADALTAAGWSIGLLGSFERPVLDRRSSHEEFSRDHPHRHRLKDLRRRSRRLAETGSCAFASATSGRDLETALEAFLAVESAGWKGQAGTALASRPKTRALAQALFASPTGPVQVRADTLSLDGRPLAVSLALVTGRTAYLLKTAYDERERALAPGLLLEAEIIRALHESRFADRLDCATLPGSALESLYRDREIIGEIIAVPPGGNARSSIERRMTLARFEHRARIEAKRLLKRR